MVTRTMKIAKPKAKATPKKKAAPKKKTVDKTHVIYVFDDSASMAYIRNAAQKAFNATITDAKESAKKSKQKTTASLYLFGETISQKDNRVPIADMPLIESYNPGQGWTRLWDAIRRGMVDSQGLLDKGETAILLMVVTDGYDNRGGTTASMIASDIAEWNKTGRFTAAAMVPPGSKKIMVDAGFAPGNVSEWEQTAIGAEVMAQANSVGTRAYFKERTSGKLAVMNFYETNASKITKKDLSKLDDLSSQFKIWRVEKEEAIAPFVERHTKKPFVRGVSFYELTKGEKEIQAYKQILIQKRGEKAIYGGPQARTMIGLPVGVNVKVRPGNHGNFRIFIQSNSDNRKLVRGTDLLYMGA